MAIRHISGEHLSEKVDLSRDPNKLSSVPEPRPRAAKDVIDLGKAWSAATSPIVQNMNQYVTSAHKMATLAQDFHRLLKDEMEADFESFAPPDDEKSALDQAPVAFNDFSEVDLTNQTRNRDSIDRALHDFLGKLERQRDRERVEKLINGRAEARAAEELEAHLKIKRIRQDKIILKKKLERILNPEKDIVIEKGEEEYLEKLAQPKPKPDISRVRNEHIMKHPEPDAAALKRQELNHQRFMDSFRPSPVVEEQVRIVEEKEEERRQSERIKNIKEQRKPKKLRRSL